MSRIKPLLAVHHRLGQAVDHLARLRWSAITGRSDNDAESRAFDRSVEISIVWAIGIEAPVFAIVEFGGFELSKFMCDGILLA